MKNLREQLERVTLGTLIANIDKGQEIINIADTVTRFDSEVILCLNCKDGKATVVTTHTVDKVTIYDGDQLTLDEYMLMNSFEREAWNSLYLNNKLEALFRRVDRDRDGVYDSIEEFDTKTDTYKDDGEYYVKSEDVENLKQDGSIDEEFVKTLDKQDNGRMKVNRKPIIVDETPYAKPRTSPLVLKYNEDGTLIETNPDDYNKFMKQDKLSDKDKLELENKKLLEEISILKGNIMRSGNISIDALKGMVLAVLFTIAISLLAILFKPSSKSSTPLVKDANVEMFKSTNTNTVEIGDVETIKGDFNVVNK